MGIFSKLFGGKDKADVAPRPHSLPTVKFDTAWVTNAVKNDLKRDIKELPDVPPHHFKIIYRAALAAISRGGDLPLLYQPLLALNIDGMTKSRAADITRLLSTRAMILIKRQRELALGISHGEWLYSRSPCTGGSPTQDAAHKQANGFRFEISKGHFVDGKWTWPGYEIGCNCIWTVIVEFPG